MIEALVLVAIVLAVAPAFMRTSKQVWGALALYVVASPILAAALVVAVRAAASSSYGVSLAGAMVAAFGGGLSVLMALVSLVVGLARSRKQPPGDEGSSNVSPRRTRASRRREKRRGGI